ncbi:MAG: hypothetical protein HYV97_17980 [Bdellovibrio sp.]|nr:hypothetical protein [Bdellovibrio sp.]
MKNTSIPCQAIYKAKLDFAHSAPPGNEFSTSAVSSCASGYLGAAKDVVTTLPKMSLKMLLHPIDSSKTVVKGAVSVALAPMAVYCWGRFQSTPKDK